MAWCVICSGTASAEPVVFRDLLHLVCSTHPLVSGRLADVDAAKLGRSSARMQFLPTPSVSTVRLDGRAATITGMNQPLWTGGRLTAGLDNANLKVELAQTGLSDSTQSLAMRTIGAYQQFVAQRDKRDSQRRNLQRLTDLGAMIERRVQQGLSAASDVSLARSRLAQARADLAVVDAQLQLALSQLGILAGRTFTEADIQLETVPSVPPERTLDEWVTEVEAIDPSLQAARLQVLIADKEAEMAASSLWPMVSLRAEHQAGYYTGAQLPGDRVSLVLNYAPGAGWSAGVERDAARARARALREGVETARRDLRERIQQIWTEWHSASARLPDVIDSRETAHEVWVSSERLFVAGRRGWLDLLNAVRELALNEQQEAEVRAQVLAGQLRLLLLKGELQSHLTTPLQTG